MADVVSLDSHFDDLDDDKTPANKDPCPHCGRTAIVIAVVCPPPPTEHVFSFIKEPTKVWETVFKDKCVISANWAWCPRARGNGKVSGMLTIWVNTDENL